MKKERLIIPSGINSNSCYTVKDVSLILGVCTKTAFKVIHSNQFKYYKVGRYGRYLRVDKASFDAWLENYKKEG